MEQMELQLKKTARRARSRSLWQRVWYHRSIYLFFLPALIAYLVFTYYPMYGAILAFKDFRFKLGILGSPWTGMYGFKHFIDLVSDASFKKAFLNTIIISFGRILWEFPVPIVLALLLNEIRKNRYKRFFQTVFTFPHFVSWVIISGIVFNLFSDSGVVNGILVSLGGQKISLLTEPGTFRSFLYATSIWKEAGWGTIIYLATITGINPSLYEAAIVDGANRWQLARYITWPSILSVVGVMLILQVSSLMNAGFDQIFNLYNAAVYDKADIIDTLIYRRTFQKGMDFSTSTAIGLFKSVINFAMLIIANFVVKKSTGKGIY